MVSGCVGPRGDGYEPGSAMTPEDAERYHAVQIGTFATTTADQVTAMTITNAEEAVGVVRAASAAGIPAAISFTVETDGRLPTGQPLHEAIEQVDAATGARAAYFMVNCAHPTHFADALATDGAWRRRLVGLRANASMRSHAELDEATELDEGDPVDLGARHAALRDRLSTVTCSAAAAARTPGMWRRSSRRGGPTRLLRVPALDAIADWPVKSAAAAVVAPSGVLAEYGATRQRFALASVTKPLAARAAQIAIEEGVVELDTEAGPPGSTVRHLLAHAAGYSMHSPELMAKPGQRRVYSNYGFQVLAETIEQASGIEFGQYLAEAVFEPLGMTDSVAPARCGSGGIRGDVDGRGPDGLRRRPAAAQNSVAADARRGH